MNEHNRIKFGEKLIETLNDDGTITIRKEGYYEGLKSVREQTREDIQTTTNTLLTDVIKCLDVLKSETPELIITIKKDKYGSPVLIQKTWIISKEKIK